MDFSKEGLEREFADNARKKQEEHNQFIQKISVANSDLTEMIQELCSDE